jgi:ferrous iron transport protein B
VGSFGLKAIVLVFTVLLLVWITLGIILRWFVKGESPEIFVEIPPYRIPNLTVLIKKLWMRTQWFIKEAVPFVLLGVLMVNILYFSGIIDFMGRLVEPLITNLMGLPRETVGALIVGFMRKDVAVGMLIPLDLTMKQMIISSVILTMYFPCIATFMVLMRELQISDMLKATLIMMTSTITVGTLLNIIL